jgi:hypothetical protein
MNFSVMVPSVPVEARTGHYRSASLGPYSFIQPARFCFATECPLNASWLRYGGGGGGRRPGAHSVTHYFQFVPVTFIHYIIIIIINFNPAPNFRSWQSISSHLRLAHVFVKCRKANSTCLVKSQKSHYLPSLNHCIDKLFIFRVRIF